jgi:hypothetical protein
VREHGASAAWRRFASVVAAGWRRHGRRAALLVGVMAACWISRGGVLWSCVASCLHRVSSWAGWVGPV